MTDGSAFAPLDGVERSSFTAIDDVDEDVRLL
jgi:hypothetical protein